MELIRALYPLRTYLVVSGVERPNVMTADWVVPLSFEPPLLGVSISKKRHTYSIIRQDKEFVISVPRVEMLDDVWVAGTKSGREVDKFKITSLRTKPSSRVSVPSLEGCIANIECVLERELETGDHVLFIGKILHADVSPEAFSEGLPREDFPFLLHVGRDMFTTTSGKVLRAEK